MTFRRPFIQVIVYIRYILSSLLSQTLDSTHPKQAGIRAGVHEPVGRVTLLIDALQLDQSARGVAKGHASEQRRDTGNDGEACHDPNTPTAATVIQAGTATTCSRNTGVYCSVGAAVGAGPAFARRGQQCVTVAGFGHVGQSFH